MGSIIAAALVFGLLFQYMRRVTNFMVCIKNMKQTNMACRMYAEDWDGHLPSAAQWMDASLPYVKNWNLYHCPEVEKEAYGYAINRTLSDRDVKRVPKPDETILLFESATVGRNANALTESMVYRHQGSSTVGYLDGHVKPISLQP